ncbi:hypothetical protein [Litoreibacter meonggei]|nr:hypothetical protein [Litoreibacter meonggei]
MRNTLAISQFFQDMAPIADVAGHPFRKQFDIIRPGGRSLDVTLAGDMSGLPVIILSTLCRHTYPAWYEEELANGGILAIHMWRQGHGRSDPLPNGSDIVQGMADDLIAPLDQLEIKRCPVTCFDASLVDMPGVSLALEEALLGSIAQGIEENCRTLHDAFGDWTADLLACPLPLERYMATKTLAYRWKTSSRPSRTTSLAPP